MAFNAIRGNIPLDMVRIYRPGIIFQVTVDAFYHQRLKPEQRSRGMTVRTGRQQVRPNERKTALLVYFRNVIDDP